MWLLEACVSSHDCVGWLAVYGSGHTHFWDGCRNTERTKVASGMRPNFHSDMPDHKEASTRVK